MRKFLSRSVFSAGVLTRSFQGASRRLTPASAAGSSSPQPLVSSANMEDSGRKHYVLPNDQPVVELDCSAAFRDLTRQEKLYAHHLGRASWNGGLIVYLQTSPESPIIYVLLHKIFSGQPLAELKDAALREGNLTDDEFQAFLVYTCGVLTNGGNYRGFGDSKIVPDLPPEKLDALVRLSEAYRREPKAVGALWDRCNAKIFSLDHKEKILGFSDKGVTTYFSSNCTLKDAEMVNRFLKKINMDAYNTRTFKTVENGATVFEIRLASVEEGDLPGVTRPDQDFEGCKFRVTRGDYSQLLRPVVEDLKLAKKYAANENQERMLERYVESFTTGSLDAHKDASRFWIKDVGPVVESYIGFIETYRDPAGSRGEFEGFVAVVNKEMSAKFSSLVGRAEELLERLPWPRALEKDSFLRPDFTSLDVLAFAGSGVPAGINIPNYDEIRQSEGFKNVSLGNVIPANYRQTALPFLSEQDRLLLEQHRVAAFELQVGLHELLGHGSGKLLRRLEDGSLNYDPAALEGLEPEPSECRHYEPGESYDGKFQALGSAYEECRAECVGLYLSLDQDVLDVFSLQEEVAYVNWLSLLHAGVAKALETYDPETETWLQAHSQARFVILRVLLEAGEGLVSVEETEEGKDLLLRLDRSKMASVGRGALGTFLRLLQLHKSRGDVGAARALFQRYSAVDGLWASRWRDIVLLHKQPRKMLIQPNTFVKDGEVVLETYEATHEALIRSFLDRFQETDSLEALEKLWDKDRRHFS